MDSGLEQIPTTISDAAFVPSSQDVVVDVDEDGEETKPASRSETLTA